MTPLSILDLAPVLKGGTLAQTFANSVDLAQHGEAWGYGRLWLAEHHNMPGIASAATALVIGQVAAATKTIRVGAGGVMLPNHSPIVVAEQFGTLETLYPERIDLGLGRAPGADQPTARALRRHGETDVNAFPRDVVELQHYFREPEPGQRVRAVPGAGLGVPIWILGSSLFGAQLAAALGLPYAFASHFAPAALMQAIEVYRTSFEPSDQLDAPYVMLGVNVFAAETDEAARLLRSSQEQAILSHETEPLDPPVAGFMETVGAAARQHIDRMMECSATGSPEAVKRWLADFVARTGADEIMVQSQIYDHVARLRSYEILADVWGMSG